MNMEGLFDRICQHFITYKKEHFAIFAHQDHLSAMGGWVRGEIVWLMHQSPLKEQEIFIATSRDISPGVKDHRPDLHLRLSDNVIYVELKTIAMDKQSWDQTIVCQLKTEFDRFFPENLLYKPSDWLISFTYPVNINDYDRWKSLVDQAGLRDYYVKDIAFDIGNSQQCLISLFRRSEELSNTL